MGAGGRALPPAAEDAGEAGGWRTVGTQGAPLQGRAARALNGSCSSVTHRECSQSPSSSSAKEASNPSPRKLDSLFTGCQGLLLHSHVCVKPLLLARLFQQLGLHQAYWGALYLRWGTHLHRVIKNADLPSCLPTQSHRARFSKAEKSGSWPGFILMKTPEDTSLLASHP